MIKTLTVTNHVGRSLKLDLAHPERSGIYIKSISGLGPPQAVINTVDIATSDGTRFNSSKLDARFIELELGFLFNPTIEDSRLKTYEYFPIKKKITLEIETDRRNCEISGYVESNEPNIFSKDETTKITINCPDPYFKSKKDQVTLFFGVIPMFEFSYSNESMEPITITGELKNDSEQTIFYEGDADVGMLMKFRAMGNVSKLEIHNTTTREKMVLLDSLIIKKMGEGIKYGDEIIINTNTGEKSINMVRNGITTNILNVLDKGSSWLNLVQGDNIFAFSAEGMSYLQFSIENKVLYEGV